MSLSQFAGYVGLAVGAILLFFAWRASNAPIDQLAEAATGRFTQTTMRYLVGGGGLAIAGVALLLFGPRAG